MKALSDFPPGLQNDLNTGGLRELFPEIMVMTLSFELESG